jgi:hypothetical protein
MPSVFVSKPRRFSTSTGNSYDAGIHTCPKSAFDVRLTRKIYPRYLYANGLPRLSPYLPLLVDTSQETA